MSRRFVELWKMAPGAMHERTAPIALVGIEGVERRPLMSTSALGFPRQGSGMVGAADRPPRQGAEGVP